MEKEFVPYELAVKLKALGFDEPCFGGFDDDGDLHIQRVDFQSDIEGFCLAPTFSQAFRWFREKHNLIFQINYLFNGNYQVVIHRNTHEYMELIQNLKHACVYEIPDNYSYEEAEIECLKKLIEIVEQKIKD